MFNDRYLENKTPRELVSPAPQVQSDHLLITQLKTLLPEYDPDLPTKSINFDEFMNGIKKSKHLRVILQAYSVKKKLK